MHIEMYSALFSPLTLSENTSAEFLELNPEQHPADSLNPHSDCLRCFGIQRPLCFFLKEKTSAFLSKQTVKIAKKLRKRNHLDSTIKKSALPTV